MSELLLSLGARVNSGRTVAGLLRDWERDVRANFTGLDPRDAVSLGRVATRFVLDTARFRAATRTAYATLATPPASDAVVLLIGSVARIEATPGSDVDFLLIAPTGAVLPEGLQTRMSKETEQRRRAAMMTQPWLPEFLATLVRFGYRRGAEYCFAVGRDEFAQSVLTQQLGLNAFARYGANVRFASMPLSDSSTAAAIIRGLPMPTVREMATYRSAIAWIKRDNAGDPHDAHSLVSQLFQALMLFSTDPRLHELAAKPYWYIPWVVALSKVGAESWIEMVRQVQLARWRQGNSLPANKLGDYGIRAGFKRLLRDLENSGTLLRQDTNALKTRVP